MGHLKHLEKMHSPNEPQQNAFGGTLRTFKYNLITSRE